MSKIKNDGLDQYGAEPFKQQQFAKAGVEGVNQTVKKTTHCSPKTCLSRVFVLAQLAELFTFKMLSVRMCVCADICLESRC